MRYGRKVRRPRRGTGRTDAGNPGSIVRRAREMTKAHPIEIAKGSQKKSGPFSRIEDALKALQAGKMVIVVDDEDRENEGDLTIAAEKVTPEAINFMARYGRGLICLPMRAERL